MFEYLYFMYNESSGFTKEIRLDYSDGKLLYKISGSGYNFNFTENKEGALEKGVADIVNSLESLQIEKWNEDYNNFMCDGYGWELTYKETGKKAIHCAGVNDSPDNFNKFKAVIQMITVKLGWEKIVEQMALNRRKESKVMQKLPERQEK